MTKNSSNFTALFISIIFTVLLSTAAFAAPSAVTVADMAKETISFVPKPLYSENDDGGYISDEEADLDEAEFVGIADAGIYPVVDDESGVNTDEIFDKNVESGILASESTATLFASKSLWSVLAASFAGFAEEIDVSSLKITTDDIQELCDVYGDVLRSDPKLYYVSFNFKYRYNSKNVITKILPQYITTNKNEIESIQFQIDARINEIASLTNDSMSDIEKLLVIYNEIILTSNYDTTLVKRTGMDILLSGESVCQGYASAMHAIANKVGIEGCFVRSEEMNHIWNAFLIDGAWYHLDATYGDPFEKYSTSILYTSFLKSNNWLLNELGYTGFVNLESTSTTYDDFFWNNTMSPVISLAGHMFFIDGKTSYANISVFNTHTNESAQIYRFTNYWPSTLDGRYRWEGTFSGLAYSNGRLYFNTNSEVLSCNLDGTDVKTEYVLPSSATNSIYGCCKSGNSIRFINATIETVTFSGELFITPSYNAKPFYIVDVFEKNGAKYISYINNSEDPAYIIAYSNNQNYFAWVDVFKASEYQGTSLIETEAGAFSISVLNDRYCPLIEKTGFEE